MSRGSSRMFRHWPRRMWLGLLLAAIVAFALTAPAASIASPPADVPNALVGAEYGALAQANFTSTDATGCIRTAAGVMGLYVSRQAPPPTHEQFSQVGFFSLDVVDLCTGRLLLEAHGGGPNIPDDQLRIEHSLRGASLEATFDVCDSVSGTCGPVHFDVTWTGAGDIERSEQTSRGDDPKSLFWARSAVRNATATATISGLGISNFAPEADTSAEIMTILQHLVVPGYDG